MNKFYMLTKSNAHSDRKFGKYFNFNIKVSFEKKKNPSILIGNFKWNTKFFLRNKKSLN